MFRRLGNLILKYPKTIIILSLALTVLLASGIPKVRIDDNLKDMLPRDLPARQALDKLEDIFGGSDVALIAIGDEKGTVFNQRTLTKIKELTDSLKVMPGIKEVTSLSTLNKRISLQTPPMWAVLSPGIVSMRRLWAWWKRMPTNLSSTGG